MRKTILVSALVVAALALFAQQRSSSEPVYEVRSVFPRETAPGEYAQVERTTIQSLSSEGWELVSVTPFIYRNEEHDNGQMHGPKPVVTQVYPAYFFKRLRPARN